MAVVLSIEDAFTLEAWSRLARTITHPFTAASWFPRHDAPVGLTSP